ncbi:hypothetical protein QFC21_006609 [Naganishia friedmannii]|uniref:Uncharacterized protein n=1 Tax=Naganishia friedmannii TaxID=89922 RepID=A0ACC2V2P9_9TREE|nr:hypothetical protein QFC21_006609 [Naganishia friedmannii]
MADISRPRSHQSFTLLDVAGFFHSSWENDPPLSSETYPLGTEQLKWVFSASLPLTNSAKCATLLAGVSSSSDDTSEDGTSSNASSVSSIRRSYSGRPTSRVNLPIAGKTSSGSLGQSTCGTSPSSVTESDNTLGSPTFNTSYITIDEAAYQLLQAKGAASAKEIERLHAILEASVVFHANTMVDNEQRLAAATSENASFASLVLEGDQTIRRLAIKVKERQAEIRTLQSEKKRAFRVHGAILLENEYSQIQMADLRTAKAEAEAKATESEARIIKAEANLTEAEAKAAAAEGLLENAKAKASNAGAEAFIAENTAKVALKTLAQADTRAVQAEAKATAAQEYVIRLQGRIRTLEEQTITVERKLKSENVRVNLFKSALKRFNNERTTLNQDITALEHDHNTLIDKYNVLFDDYTALSLRQQREIVQSEFEDESNQTSEHSCERATELFSQLQQRVHWLWEDGANDLLRLLPAAIDECEAWLASQNLHNNSVDEVDSVVQSTPTLPSNACTHDQVRFYHDRILDLMLDVPAASSQESLNLRFEMHRVADVVEMWLDDANRQGKLDSAASVLKGPETIESSVSKQHVQSIDSTGAPSVVRDDGNVEPSRELVSYESVEMVLFGYVTPVIDPSHDNPVTPSSWVVDAPSEPESPVTKDKESNLLMTPPLTETGSDLGSDEEFFEPCDLADDVEINYTLPDSPSSEIWDPSHREWVSVSDSDRDWMEQQVDGLTPSPTCEHACDPYKKDLFAEMREFTYAEEGMF